MPFSFIFMCVSVSLTSASCNHKCSTTAQRIIYFLFEFQKYNIIMLNAWCVSHESWLCWMIWLLFCFCLVMWCRIYELQINLLRNIITAIHYAARIHLRCMSATRSSSPFSWHCLTKCRLPRNDRYIDKSMCNNWLVPWNRAPKMKKKLILKYEFMKWHLGEGILLIIRKYSFSDGYLTIDQQASESSSRIRVSGRTRSDQRTVFGVKNHKTPNPRANEIEWIHFCLFSKWKWNSFSLDFDSFVAASRDLS